MNENTDRNILIEAERDRSAAQAKLRDLEIQCETQRKTVTDMEIVINYLRSKTNNADKNSKEVKATQTRGENENAVNPNEVTYIDATIKILEETGGRLHIARIIEEITKRYGKTTNARNLSGNIGKDRLDRFVNLGGNVWDLTSRYTPEQLENLKGKRKRGGAQTPTLLFSSSEGGTK